VYLGNVYARDKDDTFCPKCGTLVIQREGFNAELVDLKDGKCGKCGADLNMVV
jgi:pyruvate formate lyase activating enzyme